MNEGPPTSWTTLRSASDGDEAGRETFARRYAPAVEAYLAARWRQGPLRAEIGDAVQEVFVEFFREGGALQRVEPGRPGGFRAFLYGVVRHVARRFEERRGRRREQAAEGEQLDRIERDEATLSVVFDRAWAESMMREAARRQEQHSRGDAGAERRVELLRLRFREGLPVREVARRWDMDAARVHREYARAREDFRRALLEVLAELHPEAPGRAAKEAEELIGLLG